MSAPPRPDPTALADAFAHQVGRWAVARGVDAAGVDAVREAARAVSTATRDGHVCVGLAELAHSAGERLSPAVWRERLLGSGLVGTPAAPGACPLVLDDGNRLYLHRYFDLERRLARRLHAAADAVPAPIEPAALPALRAAAGTAGDVVDQQAVAAALALLRRLLVLGGGPGTGKTSTVVRLLAALLAQQPDARIALAAPTGKAAARMAQALAERAAGVPADVHERLPTRASTVHRLLVARGGGHGFVHGVHRPLPIDLLVVDEASMLDLALATRLLEAVPLAARIVLLGDKDQLAAVEAGAVFAELAATTTIGADAATALAAALDVAPDTLAAAVPVAPAATAVDPINPLIDSVVWFRRNHRFAADSGIGRLAAAVRDGAADAVRATLRPDADGALTWLDDASQTLGAAAWAALIDGHAPYLEQVRRQPEDVAAAMAAFMRFGLLCALQQGPRGVAALNTRVEAVARRRLAGTGPAATTAWDGLEPGADPWYVGRPVMVLRNDPVLQLFNGDVGLTLPHAAGALAVWFAAPDGGWRAVPPWRLPPHQAAYATTVHKAQGSEFDAVLVLLPALDSRVLTRELLYTAVTRARRHVTLVGSAAVIDAAVATPTRRIGGLRARLAEAAAEAAEAGIPPR
ncbi:MAG: exodeoxyribonuclease V subunit alpha [Rubrivivax sp.]